MQVKCEYSFSEIQADLAKKIKDIRKGDNSQDNCVYLTEYCLKLIEQIVFGKTECVEPPKKKSSVPLYNNQVLIKEELFENKIQSSVAIRGDEGVYAMLPAENYAIFDLTNNTERHFLDIDSSTVSRKKAETPEALDISLREHARHVNGWVFGHIVFAAIDIHQPGHMIAYLASQDQVLYLDGQLYDGEKEEGEPVFTSLQSYYQFGSSSSSSKSSSQTKGFQSNCFYLEHGRYVGVKKVGFFQSVSDPILLDALTDDLFLYVIKGKQTQVKNILSKYPKLFLEKRNITDECGQTFLDITVFTFALWALDRHMWSMMLNLVSSIKRQDIKSNLAEQYTHFMCSGIYYEFLGKRYRSLSYSPNELIDLYKHCETFYKVHHKLHSKEESIALIKKLEHFILLEQKKMPYHFRNEFCRLDISYPPLQKRKLEDTALYDNDSQFDETELPRIVRFKNKKTDTYLEWDDSLNGLEADFAIWRGRSTEAVNDFFQASDHEGLAAAANLDKNIITNLFRKRTMERAHLVEQLPPISSATAPAVIEQPSISNKQCSF